MVTIGRRVKTVTLIMMRISQVPIKVTRVSPQKN